MAKIRFLFFKSLWQQKKNSSELRHVAAPRSRRSSSSFPLSPAGPPRARGEKKMVRTREEMLTCIRRGRRERKWFRSKAHCVVGTFGHQPRKEPPAGDDADDECKEEKYKGE